MITVLNNNCHKEPVAGLSAASACIRLSHCDHLAFRPVFTHQNFKDERLPGWRPLVTAENEAKHIFELWKETNDNGDSHPSFKRFQLDDGISSRVDIHVKLSPSCVTCQVDVQTIEDDITHSEGEPLSKKAKTVRFEQSCDDVNRPEKKLDLSDILLQLSSALPAISSVHVNGAEFNRFQIKLKSEVMPQYLNCPVGHIIKSYRRKLKDTSDDGKFIMTIAKGTNQQVHTYHNSIQKLAKLFIETADDVDIGDENDGFWSVLYLFREHDLSHDGAKNSDSFQYSLAGYITLFHFHAPFKKPKSGIILRVCQALILPPYQRSGHGSDMLQSVHEYADQYSVDGQQIVEVNVEDPAPGFVALRDSIDYQRYSKYLESTPSYQSYGAAIVDENFFSPLSEDKLQMIATELKITKRQAQIVYEIHKLAQLVKWKHDADSNSIQDKETQYRLMVKKSLRALRKEELGACDGGKEGQKRLLDQWFQTASAHYHKLLGI